MSARAPGKILFAPEVTVGSVGGLLAFHQVAAPAFQV
jgi:hypothetical protein